MAKFSALKLCFTLRNRIQRVYPITHLKFMNERMIIESLVLNLILLDLSILYTLIE